MRPKIPRPTPAAFLILLVFLTSPARADAPAFARALLAGDLGPGSLPVTAEFALDEERVGPAGGPIGTVRIGVDLAGVRGEAARRPGAVLRVVTAFRLQGEEPLLDEVVVRDVDLARAREWLLLTRLEFPPEAREVAVVVEEAGSGLWGGALAAFTEQALEPTGGAVAVPGLGHTWHRVVGEPGMGMERDPGAGVASAVRLVLPRDPVLEGRTRFQTLITTDAVARVEFYLDGEKAAERSRRPFDATLDLATPARRQEVRAVAYAEDGSPLGEHTLVVNDVGRPFRVRVITVEGDPAAGEVAVAAEVAVPGGERLERVELYWNQRLAATLTAPPFRAVLPTTAATEADYVRAAAFLADGAMAEDVVLMSARGAVEEVEVNLVELFVTVTDGAGKPARDLTREDFEILDRGRRRPVEEFAYADDVPLLLGLVLDSSESMRAMLGETKQAAAQFLAATLTEIDRAFLVDFDTRPRLAHDTTGDLLELLASFPRLTADGFTALYDAILFSFPQFEDQGGRKALVLLTDGDDYRSRFGPKRCTETARALGVPIYIIGLGELDQLRRSYHNNALNDVAEETGGRVYLASTPGELGRAYGEINAELRSQYRLAFYAEGDLGEEARRRLEVRVRGRKDLAARVIVGQRPGGG